MRRKIRFNRIKINIRNAMFEKDGIIHRVKKRVIGCECFKWLVDLFTLDATEKPVFKGTVEMEERTIMRSYVEWKAAVRKVIDDMVSELDLVCDNIKMPRIIPSRPARKPQNLLEVSFNGITAAA